jgi:hypothetical protein
LKENLAKAILLLLQGQIWIGSYMDERFVCDFTATPQLACNGHDKCVACTDENKKKGALIYSCE